MKCSLTQIIFNENIKIEEEEIIAYIVKNMLEGLFYLH